VLLAHTELISVIPMYQSGHQDRCSNSEHLYLCGQIVQSEASDTVEHLEEHPA